MSSDQLPTFPQNPELLGKGFVTNGRAFADSTEAINHFKATSGDAPNLMGDTTVDDLQAINHFQVQKGDEATSGDALNLMGDTTVSDLQFRLRDTEFKLAQAERELQRRQLADDASRSDSGVQPHHDDAFVEIFIRPSNTLSPVDAHTMLQDARQLSTDLAVEREQAEIETREIKKLVRESLSNVETTSAPAEQLDDALPQHSTVETLQLTSESTTTVTSGLHLRLLNEREQLVDELSARWENVCGGPAFGTPAPECLSKLKLSGRQLSAIDVLPVAALLLGSNQLTTLELSLNNLKDEGVLVLATALKVCPALSSLGLCGNQIGAAGAEALADALVIQLQDNVESSLDDDPPGLLDLRLSSNCIGDQGMAHLSRALAANCSLKRLNVSSNVITGQGMVSLVDALGTAGQANLELFDISSNAVGCEGVAALCLLMSQNSLTIETLNVSRTACSDKGVTALAVVVADLEGGFLKKVLLSGNLFGDDACRSLAAAIEQGCTLRAVFVDSNPHCSASALATLQESADKRLQQGRTSIRVTTTVCLRAQ